MAGRFADQKGHGVLLAAARAVLDVLPDARFLLVGDGPLKPGVIALSRRAHLGERVLFMDGLQDLAAFHAACDVIAIPSLWEGLPYTLLEAMRAGKAIVASRVGGRADVVQDGQDGLLVEPGNPQSLARALVRALRDGELRSHLAEAARAKLKTAYRLDRMVAKIGELYEELSGGNGGQDVTKRNRT
jgi:glycosyltransferase involved in cell wall biosynthesis